MTDKIFFSLFAPLLLYARVIARKEIHLRQKTGKDKEGARLPLAVGQNSKWGRREEGSALKRI